MSEDMAEDMPERMAPRRRRLATAPTAKLMPGRLEARRRLEFNKDRSKETF